MLLGFLFVQLCHREESAFGIFVCITVSQRRECFWDLCLYNCVTEKRVLLGSLFV